MAEQFRWIANNIDISHFYDKLHPSIKKLIAEAEQFDRDDMMGAYIAVIDAIEIQTKLFVPDELTFEEWDMICEKYSLV